MSGATEGKGINRRGFLKGAVLGAGTVALASVGAGKAAAARIPNKWDREADVVVVGFGGTGAAAALEAHDNGAKVLIIEKAPMAGGSTAISGGIVYAAGTSIQQKAGVSDNPEEMYKYWMASNNGLLDPDLLHLLSRQSADAVEWLLRLGVEMPTDLLYYSGLEEQYKSAAKPAKRGHCAKGRGKGLMTVLVKAVQDRKINVLYETPAERLVVNDEGMAIGVTAKGPRGPVHIKANRAVVLASGGFSRNKEMVKSFFPLQIKAVPVVAQGLVGDGIRMAEKIGSPIRDTGTVELPPSLPALEIVPEQKALMFSSAYFLYKYPAIFVNESAKRFFNETEYYQVVSPQILKQKAVFVIFDDRVRKEAGGSIGFGFSADLSTEIKNGWLKQGQTVDELAKAISLDAAALKQTVDQFNASAKQGKDPAFGRAKAMGPIETAPFYAGKVTVAVVESFGGLRINTKAQVIDAFNEPIPHLYTGGAMAATMRAYAGSGAFLNTCFVLGRVAGKNAAKENPWK